MVGTPPTGDELRLLRLDAGSDAIVDVGPLGTRAEPAGQFGSSFVLDYQPSAGTPSALTRLDIPSLGTTILGPSPVTGAQQPVFLAPPVQLPSGIYFAARDATGIEPWVSNGTIAGTRRIADAAFLPPEAADGNPAGYAALGSRVAFRASPQNVPQQLWSSDGTTVGTGTIADGIAQGAPLGSLLEIGGRVALRRGGDLVLVDPSGLQPEVLASSVVDDGLAFGRGVLSVLDTGAGTRTTVRVTTDGVQTPLDSSPTSLGPVEPVVVTGEYGWFRAGSRALFTDGTTTTQPPVGGSLSTFPRLVAVPFDGSVWARGSDENGSEPVRRARSSSITQLGVLGSSGDLVVVDELLYSVSATDAGNVGIRFTDGTFTGTVPSSPPCDFGVALGSQLLAVTEDDALILADQSAPIAPLHAGPIKRIPASDPVAPPRAAVYPVSRELAYFVVATSFATPDQLWQTDGTAAGTSFVQDLDVLDAAALQGSLYLTVDDGIAHGIEPFVLRPPVFNLPVGASCSGHPTGTHTLRTDVDPRVGRTVQILGRSRVDGAGSGQFAGIFLGSAGDAPVFLGPSKCAFRLDFNRPIAALTVPVGAAGDFSVALTIPQAPVFVGAELLFQALVTPSPSPIGVDITNGLLWVIGG
jgi:ELWxxDGT repeat protein